MSKLKNLLERSLGPVLTVFAIAIAIVVGGFAFTDYPQKFGLVAASE